MKKRFEEKKHKRRSTVPVLLCDEKEDDPSYNDNQIVENKLQAAVTQRKLHLPNKNNTKAIHNVRTLIIAEINCDERHNGKKSSMNEYPKRNDAIPLGIMDQLTTLKPGENSFNSTLVELSNKNQQDQFVACQIEDLEPHAQWKSNCNSHLLRKGTDFIPSDNIEVLTMVEHLPPKISPNSKLRFVEKLDEEQQHNFTLAQQKNIPRLVHRNLHLKSVLRKETIDNAINEFSSSSTIDALHYINGSSCKIIWKIFFTVVTIYCCYQCKLNVDTYLRYNLSTKITHQSYSNIEFPAITFCPMRMFKKSKYGNQPHLYLTLSLFYGNSLSELDQLYPENNRSCNNYNNLTELDKEREFNEFNEKIENGSVWLTNEYVINYQDVFLECVWEKKRIDCSDAFVNHISDVGLCFTFNPGYEIAESTNSTETGYGINLAKYKEKRFMSGRGNTGLKLFINIKQAEYCGNELTKRGAGLFFQIHGTNSNPSFLINPSTYISPGYDMTVAMMTIVYKRKTEHLGNCTTNVPLYLFHKANVEEYIIEHCYMQCLTEYILKSCYCYPPNLGAFHVEIMRKAKDMGLETEKVKVCLGYSYLCVKEWLHNVMDTTSLNVLCSYCKQPCEETRYSLQTTSLLLSPQNLQISQFTNESFNEFRKNYVIASFVLGDNDVQLIVEKQEFDLQDLFIYIGNNIGLYLGMSFTSMIELLYFINKLIVFFCIKIHRSLCELNFSAKMFN